MSKTHSRKKDNMSLNIRIVKQGGQSKPGLTAKEMRGVMSNTASPGRKGIQYIDPMGNTFDIQPGKKIIDSINEQAQSKGLIATSVGNPLVTHYTEQYEKDFALKHLTGPLNKDEPNYHKSAMRAPKTSIGPDGKPQIKDPIEYDSYVITIADKDALLADDVARAEFMNELTKAAKDSFSSGALACEANGDKFGANGQRPIFISDVHDNTGNMHIHLYVSRHSFDMQGKEISTAIDLSNSGTTARFNDLLLDKLKSTLESAGVLPQGATFSFNSETVVNVTKNADDLLAQNKTKQDFESADIETSTVREVELTNADGTKETQTLDVTHIPEANTLEMHGNALKRRIAERNAALVKIERENAADLEQLNLINKSQQMYLEMEAKEQDRLKTQQELTQAQAALEAQQAALTQATQDNEALTTAKAALEEEKNELESALTITKTGLVSMGENLAEQAEQLGLDADTTELLLQGNLAALNSVMEQNAKTIAAWGEALDQIPDDYASALREDPIDGLTNLLTKLETFEKDYNEAVIRNEELQANNGLLIQERDGLLGERENLLGKLDQQATQHAEELKAKDAAHALAVQELQIQLKEMQDALNAANTKAATLEGKLEGIHEMYEAQLAQRIKEIEAANQAKEVAEKALRTEQEKTSDLNAQIAKLTSQQKIFETLISGNITDPKKFETTRATLDDATLATAVTKLLEVENAKADLQEQLLAKNDAVDSLTKQLEAAQKNEAEAVETFAKANDDFALQVSSLNERITELTKEGKDAKSHVSDLTKQLKEAKEALEAAKKAAEAKAPAKEGKETKAPALDGQSKQILDFLANNADMKDLLLQAANNPNVAQELANLLNPGAAPAQDWTEGLDPTKDQDPGKNLDDDLDIK